MVAAKFEFSRATLLHDVASGGRHILADTEFFVLALLSLALIYAIGLAIYRLYFHPLSKYPGPRLAAITSMYWHFHTLRGADPRHALELHNKYGRVVRYGPNHLIFNEPMAWKDIYGHRTGGRKPNRKLQVSASYHGHENIIQASTEENHGRQRRIFSNAFSDQALRKQEPMFRRYVDILINSLNKRLVSQPEQAFDLVNYYNFTTFDVMSDLTFSESLGMLETSDYSPWVKLIFRAVKSSRVTFIGREYPLLNWFLRRTVFSGLIATRAQHLKYAEEKVNRRLAKGTEQPDIWKLVMSQKGDRVLDKKEMYANAALFMGAGSETTATLLSGLTYYLLKAPHAMKKLQDELNEAFPGGANITGEKLAQLSYLHACLQEALRIYPPVPVAMLRITPDEGALICGEYLPGQTRMGVTQWAAYHSEDNFASPHEFIPERWLDGEQDGSRFKNDKRDVVQPFSAGPRNCIGRNMAWFEMRMIVAEMLLTYNMELCPESEGWEDQKVFTLWEKKPLMVKLKRREGIDATSANSA